MRNRREGRAISRKTAMAVLICINLTLLIGCGGGGGGSGGSDDGDLLQPGVLGGACLADGSCDGILECEEGICVAPPEEGEGGPADNSGDGGGGIGSACGTCNTGLTCVTDAPGGYCSKACNSSVDCGASAYCYNTDTHGSVCLAACNADQDCRQGYTCQGEAGATACYPAPGGGTSGGNYTNANLLGCYSMNGEIFFQLMFDGVNRFVDVYWSATSGEVRYGGTYTVSGNLLTCDYFDGKTENYTLVILADGITLDGTFYQYTGSECQ